MDPCEGGGGPAGFVFELAPYGACLGGGDAGGVGDGGLPFHLEGAMAFDVGIMGFGAGCKDAEVACTRAVGCRGLGGGPRTRDCPSSEGLYVYATLPSGRVKERDLGSGATRRGMALVTDDAAPLGEAPLRGGTALTLPKYVLGGTQNSGSILWSYARPSSSHSPCS